MIRNIDFWRRAGGKAPVECYLDSIDISNHKHFLYMDTWIRKIAEHGLNCVDNDRVEKFIMPEIKFPILSLKKQRHKYRIYSMLTPVKLYLLEGCDKKTNKLDSNTKKTIISRASDLILQYHL